MAQIKEKIEVGRILIIKIDGFGGKSINPISVLVISILGGILKNLNN